MASISIRHVYKIYPGNVTAVDDCNLEISDKEFVVLVGPSGCGKSTTLRMIAGLEGISKGELYIGDRLVNDVPPKDRNIAMVFQSYALYPHMTVYDNMAFGLKLRKTPKAEIERRKQAWYRPYAQAMSDLVDEVLRRLGRCLIVDLHSYAAQPLPYERHPAQQRPEVCLGFEPFHAPGIEAADEVLRGHGYETARNEPFAGSYVPLKHWRADNRVSSVMIEVRKDQYLDGA